MILIVGGYEEGVSWAWYQQMATMSKVSIHSEWAQLRLSKVKIKD